MNCPYCNERFEDTNEFINHLLSIEGFTKDQVYGRMIVIGMLTNEEIDKYYDNGK
jgi:hypothetical protein